MTNSRHALPVGRLSSLILALVLAHASSAAKLQSIDGKNYEGDARFDSGQILITPKQGAPLRLNLDELLQADFRPDEPPKPIGPSGPLDRPWNIHDVGPTGVAGSAQLIDGKFALKGAGADIKGAADSFCFVYQELRGDVQLVARVGDLPSSQSEAKVGLMIRENFNERGSRTVFLFTQPRGGVSLASRPQMNAELVTTPAVPTGKSPLWLRLARVRDTIIAYNSSDGLSWTPIGQPIDFQRARRDGRQTYIGLAVCGGNVNALCPATFDNVTLQPAAAGDDGQVKWSPPESPRPIGPILNRAILFRNGTLIGNLNIHSADDKTIRVIRADGKPLTLSTSEVARLIVGPVSAAQLAKIPPNGLGVLLAKGDFLESEFASYKGGRLKINSVLFGISLNRANSKGIAWTHFVDAHLRIGKNAQAEPDWD